MYFHVCLIFGKTNIYYTWNNFFFVLSQMQIYIYRFCIVFVFVLFLYFSFLFFLFLFFRNLYVQSTSWHVANMQTKGVIFIGDEFGLVNHEVQSQLSHAAQSEVPVACVAAGRQMFIRLHTTDAHSCSGSLGVSQLGTSHLWYMSHGVHMHCAQWASHGCPSTPPHPYQTSITLKVGDAPLSLGNKSK